MKKTLSAAIVLALAAATSVPALAANTAAPTAAVATQDEIAAVRQQIQALAERLQKLEQANQALSDENAALKAQGEKLATAQADADKSRDAQSDAIAKASAKVAGSDWASRIKWNGDLRYRNESITRDVKTDQVRDRLRARFGFTAKATDTISVTARFATGGDDPRSTNQTLGADGSGMARRSIGLDQYFATWKPLTGLTVTAGKQPMPWFRPGQSLFEDGDINPEGLSVNYQNGLFFGSAYGIWLSEIGANNINPTTGVASPSKATANGATYDGLQLGVRVPLGSVSNLAASLMYSNCGGCKNHQPMWAAGANGNTTVTVSSVALLAYEYRQIEAALEYNTKFDWLPFQAFGNYVKNGGASNGQDSAFTVGFLLGKASDKGTWEVGYAYERMKKDAILGQFVDSDFGGGNTDTKGSVIRLGYAPAKNWTVNATYFINSLNNTGTVSATAPRDESYKRLQLDVGVKY